MILLRFRLDNEDQKDRSLNSTLAIRPQACHHVPKSIMTEHRYDPDPQRASETYDLINLNPLKPSLPGEVVVMETIDEIIDHVARDLLEVAMASIRAHGDFHLALSGGNTPQPLYRRMMYDPNLRALPWRRTHLWLVDERCVPLDHPDSNFNMLREMLIVPADIPIEQVHAIKTDSPEAAQEYETLIREALQWREKGHDHLDYVLLGMGTDGHTASLFPHTEALNEEDKWIRSNSCIDAQPSQRVTMTYPLLNAANFIAVLITGQAKASMVLQVASGEELIEDVPIMGILPEKGQLKWYLDQDACSGFAKPSDD